MPAQDPIVNFLGTKIAGGSPPDVAMLPQVGAIKQAVEKKWAKPRRRGGARPSSTRTTRQGWQDLGAVDGKQYGVYFKAANKSLIWYNAKAFENAGASEPKTWKDFLTTAETVSDSGVTPVSVGGADGWTLTDWFENVYLSQAGPEKYDQLAQHKIKWTDPSVKDALTTLGQLFGKQGPASRAARTARCRPSSRRRSPRPSPAATSPRRRMVFEGDFVRRQHRARPRRRSARTPRCSRSRRSATRRPWSAAATRPWR